MTEIEGHNVSVNETPLCHCAWTALVFLPLCLHAVCPSARSPVTRHPCVTEPGQRPHLHHLLPPVPGDAIGQAAEQGGGDQNSAVDLHQVISGEGAGG